MLATMGGWIAWLFAPLGFGTWQGAAASVSAEIAKEQATATLGLVAANMDGATTGAHIINLFKSMSAFPKLAAMSFMLFTPSRSWRRCRSCCSTCSCRRAWWRSR